MIENLIAGLVYSFSPSIFIFIFAGVAGGIIIGALPGLTATMGVAVLLPLTFGLDAGPSFAMLLGVYVGAIYGGAIAAILLKTPGTPAAAATVLDGYAMTQKGEAAKAMTVSTTASFTGGMISTIVLITISPILAKAALRFAAPEYFMLAIFGLTIIGGISGSNPLKGLIAGMFGLILCTVGLDPITSAQRFTFGNINLYGGLSLIPVLIGLFALSEAFVQMETIRNEDKTKLSVKFDRGYMKFKELIKLLPTMIKSGIIGTAIGVIPGAGADIAAFVTYNEARRSSKEPDSFGKGNPKGIAAPEAGSSGVTGGAMVPLLSLGVPGDAVAAVLLGALIIQGLQPGPLLFQEHSDVVYGIFSTLIISNILVIILGLLGIKLFCRVVELPKPFIISVIIILSIVGSYAMNNNIFDVWMCLLFGVIGYGFQKGGIPASPIILALILGPMAESNLRRALLMYEGSYSFIWTRPISIVFLILIGLSIYSMVKKMKADKAKQIKS
ncbi:MAG: tripartite tricarboxylate transporter permease [Elusimicrobiota bacterium]|jgi:putative tricarboxylic transport membrane protein|nr:tripartite tricarboxylate transporter permease [Elusimicrobiota bacterium]